jgi:TetR/AcrR family transcriptional regulator, fatty acid metabolism regulator protein
MKRDLDAVKKVKEGAIFDAALRVIKQRGFHKARMSDIAREAGISYGLVYHYFANKEDLFDVIANRWWEGLFGIMTELHASDAHVHQKLGRVIFYFLDTYHRSPELMNIFITEISRSSTNLTSARLEDFKGFMAETERIITEGQEKGVFRTDFKARYLTYIFLGSLEAFVSTMVLADQKIKGDPQKRRIAESILEVFVNGARNQQRS